MPYVYQSRTPPSGCWRCHTTKHLQLCNTCKVAKYCSEHEAGHGNKQGTGCGTVDSTRFSLDFTYAAFVKESGRQHDPVAIPWNHHLAATNVHGYYRGACYNYARALHSVATQQSLEEQLKYFEICHKFEPRKCDFLLPAVLIRLHRDQEAWSLVKDLVIYALYTSKEGTGFDDLVPLFHINPFDKPGDLFRSHGNQYHMLATLIKIRMILDIESAIVARASIGTKLPQELVAMTLSYVPVTDIIACDPDLAYLDYGPMIMQLRQDVMWLFMRVDMKCEDMWYYILHGNLPSDRTCRCQHRSRIEENLCASNSSTNKGMLRTPWIESPGAMDYLAYLMSIRQIMD